MPEAIGLLLLAPFSGVSGIAGLGSITGTTIFGVGLPTLVGGAAILGVTIGLQYALKTSTAPTAESGSQPLQQAVPPRIRAYGTNRLAGYYMYFGAPGLPVTVQSLDVVAFHSGRIESIETLYLHDNATGTTPSPITHGAIVNPAVGAIGGASAVRLQCFFGFDNQDASGNNNLINQTASGGEWTVTAKGQGIACAHLVCERPSDPNEFTRIYPQGLPLPSFVCKCSPIWDPRDPSQLRFDQSTWRSSNNPVLQLIDYLTREDGGMGLNIDEILPPGRMAQWLVEANLCDGLYACDGWYKYDNSPETIVGKILATCDGWLADAGDGTLSLTVGVLRNPNDPPITADQLLGWSINYGMADEDSTNQIEVNYTNAASGYVTDQIDPVRDEAAISASGIVRSRTIDLTWVQNPIQANILAQRALQRSNPRISGTFVMTLYGMRYLGKRWVTMQLPFKGLENAIVEIQDKANIDLIQGRMTFTWNLLHNTPLG